MSTYSSHGQDLSCLCSLFRYLRGWRVPRVVRLWVCGLTSLCCITLYSGSVLAAGSIGVLYPEIREPYNQIFVSITAGITEQHQGDVNLFKLQGNTSVNDIKLWLVKHEVNALITLGSQGLTLGQQLQEQLPVVAGAVSINAGTNTVNGISMHVSPSTVLQNMAKLLPNVRTVHFVFHPKKQQWLLDWIQEAAQQTGIRLEPHPASDLSESANRYRQLLGELDPKTEALWLLSSPSIMEPAIMGDILQQAWRRNLPVFSNSVADVKRGALFALYPNNRAMGMSLARLLAAQPSDDGRIILLTDVLIAINQRTASHLGLYFTKSEQEGFDLVYPQR